LSTNRWRDTALGLSVGLLLTAGTAVLVDAPVHAAAGAKKHTVTVKVKASVKPRSKYTVKGKVRPAAPRAKVKVQRKRANGTWRTVDRERLSAGSRYSFRLTAGKAGATVKVRVVKLATRTRPRAVSRVRTVHVVKVSTASRPTAPSAAAQHEARVLQLTNALRASGTTCGTEWMPPAAPLAAEPRLGRAARAHADDMLARGYMAHDSPEGTDPWVRMVDAGYTYANAAENIAAGQPSPESAVGSWTGSAGHCRNMMNPALRDLGVGYAGTSNGQDNRWVQVFGTPRG
jgi:uncharacterized protein YkwD